MLPFTHIFEHARISLGNLSRDEYALCNFIQVLSSHPNSSRPGWCDSTREQKADFVGLSLRGLDKMEARLVQLELIVKDKRHTKTTTKWWDAVQMAKAETSKSAQSAGLPAEEATESAQSAGLQSAQSAGKTGTKCTKNLHKVQPLSNNNNKGITTGENVVKNPPYHLRSSPNATTPDELFAAMGEFYKQNTEEWATGIMENSKGSAWSNEERGLIVRTFTRWAIENNKGQDTYHQLNARLQRWFSDQHLRKQAGQGLGGIPTNTTGQAPGSTPPSNNPAFKPL